MSVNKVLVLGPAGTYGHEAVSLFPRLNDAGIIFCASNSLILEGVLNGAAEFGVAPIENSTTGFIRETVRFWLRQDGGFSNRGLYAIGEKNLAIKHCLMAHDNKTINIVESHPEALEQCRGSLRVLLPKAILRPTISTAAAAESLFLAQKIAAENPLLLYRPYNDTAAIASKFAAEMYELKILKENIQDNNSNTTRFHLLAKKPSGATGDDKTAVIFWLENRFGSLFEAIEIFKATETNMTSIHSIPLGPGEFAFYVEFDGHRESEPGRTILNILGRRVLKMVVLGSFPKAT